MPTPPWEWFSMILEDKGVKKGIRDMVAISKIKETEASLWDYSEMAIHHKCLQLFKKYNIKGPSIGYTKKGTARHGKIKIEHAWREIKKEVNSLHTIEELCKMKQRGRRLTNLTTNLFSTSKTFTSQDNSRRRAQAWLWDGVGWMLVSHLSKLYPDWECDLRMCLGWLWYNMDCYQRWHGPIIKASHRWENSGPYLCD